MVHSQKAPRRCVFGGVDRWKQNENNFHEWNLGLLYHEQIKRLRILALNNYEAVEIKIRISQTSKERNLTLKLLRSTDGPNSKLLSSFTKLVQEGFIPNNQRNPRIPNRDFIEWRSFFAFFGHLIARPSIVFPAAPCHWTALGIRSMQISRE